MKKLFSIFSVLLIMLAIGCGSPGQTTQQSQEDKQVKLIQTALGCSDEIAKKSYKIMESVDLVPFSEIKQFNNKDVWKIKVGKLFVSAIGTKDKGFTIVQAEGKILYENGKDLMKSSDFLVTMTEADKCKRRAERVVKERLKDPDSVKFNDKNWGVNKKDGMFIAQGEFRAKNSFGAYVMNYYTVTIDKDFNVKSVKIDPY